MTHCPECSYRRQERAGFFMEAGHDQRTADTLAVKERCDEHTVKQPELSLLAKWLAEN